MWPTTLSALLVIGGLLFAYKLGKNSSLLADIGITISGIGLLLSLVRL